MKLSVIIPTRNRATLLERALNSLFAQTLSQEHFEVIVVDNGSTDNTSEVVHSFETRLKNIRYFLELEPGLHVGRHKGCIEAESNLLVFTDDDIEAFPTWLQAIEDSFDDEEVVMVGGKCLPNFEAEPPCWVSTMWLPNVAGERSLVYLSVIDLGDETKTVNPSHVYGCNFAVRRSVLLEAGGFHPDAMPQELIRFRGDGESYVSKYIQTKGYKALYNPLASVYHWIPINRMTTEYFCRRVYNQGISESYTAIRHSKGIEPGTIMESVVRNFYYRLGSESFSAVLGAVSLIIKFLTLYIKGQGSLAREELALRRILAVAYQTGYNYHQVHVRQSPELLAWVLRPDYWDCSLTSMGSYGRT